MTQNTQQDMASCKNCAV